MIRQLMKTAINVNVRFPLGNETWCYSTECFVHVLQMDSLMFPVGAW